MIQFKLLEFLDAPTPYKYRHKASDIDIYLYKICDDSIRLRHFLSVNNEDKIEVIFSDYKGYLLYEIIDGNDILHSIIDFDLSIKILDAIIFKLLGS